MRIPETVNKNNVCVLTGAGVSAESGVPTFRGGGESTVWKGMPFDVISSAQMVQEDLDEVWEWFDYRRDILADCQPNPAHFALAAIEEYVDRFVLATQNVDGLHDRAGSKEIIELHGNINRAKCTSCGERVELEFAEVPHSPDSCPVCSAKTRPDVVLFGEMLPTGAFEKANEAASQCGVFLLLGTSALVYPAAALPQTAINSGAFIIEVNPEETPLSTYCDLSVRGAAGEVLPALAESIWGIRK